VLIATRALGATGDAIAKQRMEPRRNERQIVNRAQGGQCEGQEVWESTKALTASSTHEQGQNERRCLHIIVRSAGLMQTLAWRARLAAKAKER